MPTLKRIAVGEKRRNLSVPTMDTDHAGLAGAGQSPANWKSQSFTLRQPAHQTYNISLTCH